MDTRAQGQEFLQIQEHSAPNEQKHVTRGLHRKENGVATSRRKMINN